jgi:hypothetical protein
MAAPDISKITQGEGQDRNVFNNFKRFIRDVSKLTNEQIALAHFETWHEARQRAADIQE